MVIDDIIAFRGRDSFLCGTTRMPTLPSEACLAGHDFVGGSIFMPSCHFAMSTAMLVVLPQCFTAAPQCQYSTSLLFTNFASTTRNPTWSATILLILLPPVASALSNSSPISATMMAAFQLLPMILTWRQQQRKEPKHSKNLLAWNSDQRDWCTNDWDIATIKVAKNIVISSKMSYCGYNIDAAIISLWP